MNNSPRGIESVRRLLYLVVCCLFLTAGEVSADFESEVIDLVNEERAAHGLPPLSYDYQLAEAARGHSEDMAIQDYFSHTSLDGRIPSNRIADAGYSYNSYGENIAAGYRTPEAAMNGWMTSPGHRANILGANFCDIGVGYAYQAGSEYGHYWTQNFGRKRGVGTCPGIATYAITAVAGAGGEISPEGTVSVYQGGSLTLDFIPDPGYSVAEVLVDGETQDIATSYTFSNVAGDHTIEVNFDINSFPPTADAGPAQIVAESETVTLDASQSADTNDKVVAYEWSRIGGAELTLSDENSVRPTFVASPVTEDTTVIFQLTVYDSGGLSDSDTVEITILENGIREISENVIMFQTTAAREVGIISGAGADLVSLNAVDPEGDTILDRTGMPDNLIYGLLDFKIRVPTPGSSAAVTIFLPEPVPEGYKWFKYSPTLGWYDFSANVSFNGDRNQLTVTLVDGGTGDDDGDQNGIIEDPSGLGLAPADSTSTDTGSGGSGISGCFIDTLSGNWFGRE